MRDGAFRDKYPRIAPASRSPRTSAYRRFRMSRPRSRRLGPPPGSVRGAWRAFGDGSHIEIVTSGTDAEDGKDYQRRRAERAGGWRGRVMNPEPPNARPVNLGEPDRERLHGQRIHGRLPPKPC